MGPPLPRSRPAALTIPGRYRLERYLLTQLRVLRHWPSGPLVAWSDPLTAAALKAFAEILRLARAAMGTRRAGPATAGTTNL
jgi:hypothetical protein